jgi:hypothetical protein
MSQPHITAEAVRGTVLRARRECPWKMLARLEHAEPELAELVLEELSELHQVLMRSQIPRKRVRQLDRRVQSLLAVTAVCLLNARYPSSLPRPSHPSCN